VKEAWLNEKKIQLINISPFANFTLRYCHDLLMSNGLGIALATNTCRYRDTIKVDRQETDIDTVTEGDKCRTFMTTMKIHHMGNYSIY
jgi:hypothetical protein